MKTGDITDFIMRDLELMSLLILELQRLQRCPIHALLMAGVGDNPDELVGSGDDPL
jgi:hypothetical protein